MKANEHEDFIFPISMGPQQSKKISSFSTVTTTYRIRITGVVGSIESYADEIEVLENASEDDIIYAQISSPGGNLDTCDFICRRLAACKAHIVMEIGMTCASAASAFALQADEWVLGPSSTMMVHNCSYGIPWGKESDVYQEAEISRRLSHEWFKRTYTGFLTDEEIDQALKWGQDIYFFADELADRLDAYQVYRIKEAEEAAAIKPLEVDTDGD